MPSTVRAVIYARFSSHSQQDQSIDGQIRACREYAERVGYTVIGEYIDRRIPGKTDSRPEFQRLIRDAQKGGFSFVLVWKFDRFARNRYDSAIYKARLQRYGAKLVSVTEAIPDNPEGVILEAILEGMAEYYSLNLSQNIRRGQRETILQGKTTGGYAPLGYKIENGRYQIDESAAPYVRYIFEAYASGTKKAEIIAEVARRGLRNRAGKPFSFSSFSRLLSNEKYIGVLEQSGERVEGAVPALIDAETFCAAQAKLLENARIPGKGNGKVEFMLTGKIFCGHCSAAMHGTSGTGRHGGQFYYYGCLNRLRGRGCAKKNERKAELEAYVISQTLAFVLTPERIEAISAAVVAEYAKDFAVNGLVDLQKQIAKLDRDINSYVETIPETPKNSRGVILAKIEDLSAQKQDLEGELFRREGAARSPLTIEQVSSWLESFAGGDVSDADFCRRVTDAFVSSVWVYDDKIAIFYNVQSGKSTDEISFSDVSEIAPEGSALEACAPPKVPYSNPD
jgi:DNA invertase Pin-like site-specific DNA recombinase